MHISTDQQSSKNNHLNHTILPFLIGYV